MLESYLYTIVYYTTYVHIECVRVLNDVNAITARVSVGHSYEYIWMCMEQ